MFIRYLTVTLFTLAALGSSGCAQLPSTEELQQLPVITFGDAVPQGKPYILYFPAGKPIPNEIAITGNLLRESAKQTMTVSLNKDIYSYKQWVSFDGKNWVHGRDVMTIKLDVAIPSHQHPKSGHIQLDVNQKPNG